MTEFELKQALERAFDRWRGAYNEEHAAKIVDEDATGHSLRAKLWAHVARELQDHIKEA